ncbi:MAG: hypothetical protein H3C29_09115 [Simplicispira suum]|uniref:hypothetical protein n=1 Tax=Simplicispira suum TaxID=2109915 RepID=UPI001C6CBE4E|nr:hypothetical protein [Simplicispira suum]MBW7833362.1 hypothetical protein [Simplicispira suum]
MKEQPQDTTPSLDRPLDVEQAPSLHAQSHRLRDAELDAIVQIVPTPGGVCMYFPYLRAWRRHVLWPAIGVVFAAIALFTARSGAPFGVLLGLGAVATGANLLACYVLGNSFRVVIDGRGVQTERRLFGLMLAQRSVPAGDIAGLAIKLSYTTETNEKEEAFYRIYAVLKNGKRAMVADSLRGRPLAERLLSLLAFKTPYDRTDPG